MSKITSRAIAAGRLRERLRARMTRRESCPNCCAVGSMLRVFDAEDWAVLGQATISRGTCSNCGAGIVERSSGYPSILATERRLPRSRRLFPR